MIVIEEQENEISIHIAQLVNDYNLYKQSRDLLTQLNPLSRELSILKKDFATVAYSYNVLMTLLEEETLRSHHQQILKKESGFEAIPLFTVPHASSI